jgi:hypothetical protein
MANDNQLWQYYIARTWGDVNTAEQTSRKHAYFQRYQRALREHEFKRQERHQRRIESWNAGVQPQPYVALHCLVILTAYQRVRATDPVRRLDYSTFRLLDIEFVSLAHALSYASSLLPIVVNLNLRKTLLAFAAVGLVRYVTYESYYDEEGTEKRTDRKQAVYSALFSGAILALLKVLLERWMYTNYKRGAFAKRHGTAVPNPFTVSYYKYSLLCRLSLTGVLSIEPIVQFPYIVVAIQRIAKLVWSTLAGHRDNDNH